MPSSILLGIHSGMKRKARKIEKQFKALLICFQKGRIIFLKATKIFCESISEFNI